MSEIKVVAASIVNFLKQQLDSDSLSVDSRESVEVGVQCIETAYELTPDELSKGVDLLQLVRQKITDSDAVCAEAEKLKNEGNELMKSDRYVEALEKYNRAIQLNAHNSVYFCNRAAANFKLGKHEAAVADCNAALALQPNYGKAHGRLGLALTALDRHSEARTAFARAAQLEPDNESYKQNLRLAEERCAQNQRPQSDIGGLLRNPALLNMASEMLADPNLQSLISNFMSTTVPGAAPSPVVTDPNNMSALIEAGQALAQQIQNNNPDLIDQLRRQMNPSGTDGNQPPPSQ